MWCFFRITYILFLVYFITIVHCSINENNNFLSPRSRVFWPNATIPFYITPEHFDHEQSLAIMSTLAVFAFKTCLKFVPVLVAPQGTQHAMVFENPRGVRKCLIDTEGHVRDEVHHIILGYDCLRSPNIDMIIMKALGFPFEHNKLNRDIYIDVQLENVEPGAIDLFAKEPKLPLELHTLPYDVDSVMHFGERDYSKNGHRTIIFKGKKPCQSVKSLTSFDLKKIDIIYGDECRKRDRQEKIELCQNYPGVARRKREVDVENYSNDANLRVNREIKPPPTDTIETDNVLSVLGIQNEVQSIVDQVYKVSSKALSNAREKYCNDTKSALRLSDDIINKNDSKPDVVGIIDAITTYAKNMVEKATANLTEFCTSSESFELARYGCGFYNGRPCPQTYRSTKSGAVRYSTQHRPIIVQSTKHHGNPYKNKNFLPLRSSNDTEVNKTNFEENKREKRSYDDDDFTTVRMERVENDYSNRNDRDIIRKRNQDTIFKNQDLDVEMEDSRKKREVGKYNDTKPSSDFAKSMSVKNYTTEENNKVIKDSRDSVVKVKLENRRIFKKLKSHRDEDFNDSDISNEKVNMHQKLNKHRERHADRNDNENRQNNENEQDDDYDENRHNYKNKHDNNDEKRNNYKNEHHYKLDDEDGENRNNNKNEFKERNRQKVENRHKGKKKLSYESRYDENRHDENRYNDEIRNDEKRRPGKRQELVPSSKPKHKSKQAMRETIPEDRQKQIIITEVELTKANKEFYDERKWPEGVVPYVLMDDSNYNMVEVRDRIEEVNSILKEKTCVQLKEITEADASKTQDYLVLDTGADYVTGRVGGRQTFGCLELYRGGQHKQHAAMMIMAMLGFYFELSRHDRDKYVRVHLRHVRPDKLHHFEKIRSDATFNLPYDYESATHPAWQFWRKIGKSGISSVATYKTMDPDGSIMKSFGQHTKLLSDIDLIKINSIYGTKCFDAARSRPKNPSGKKRHRQRERSERDDRKF